MIDSRPWRVIFIALWLEQRHKHALGWLHVDLFQLAVVWGLDLVVGCAFSRSQRTASIWNRKCLKLCGRQLIVRDRWLLWHRPRASRRRGGCGWRRRRWWWWFSRRWWRFLLALFVRCQVERDEIFCLCSSGWLCHLFESRLSNQLYHVSLLARCLVGARQRGIWIGI